jgi:hypothetical protein
MKYGLNKIKIRLFTQQVGQLGGKGVEFHPWGSRSSLTNDMRCVEHWNIDQIFCT